MYESGKKKWLSRVLDRVEDRVRKAPWSLSAATARELEQIATRKKMRAQAVQFNADAANSLMENGVGVFGKNGWFEPIDAPVTDAHGPFCLPRGQSLTAKQVIGAVSEAPWRLAAARILPSGELATPYVWFEGGALRLRGMSISLFAPRLGDGKDWRLVLHPEGDECAEWKTRTLAERLGLGRDAVQVEQRGYVSLLYSYSVSIFVGSEVLRCCSAYDKGTAWRNALAAIEAINAVAGR